MTDLRPTVGAALAANSALTTLLGGDRIYFQQNPNDESIYATFFQLTDFAVFYADDTELGSEIHFQVDVWNTVGGTAAIAAEVDRTMREIGFIRTSDTDLYEPDTGTYHEALRFKIFVDA